MQPFRISKARSGVFLCRSRLRARSGLQAPAQSARGAHSTPRLRRHKAAQAAGQATKQALTAAALSWILPGSRQAACRESPRRAPELDAAAPLCHPPPLKQELHKRLPGAFQKVLTDKHAASVRHAEGGAFQILRVFQIHDHAAPAHKKACVIL